jgi:pimeloyl-ACP methyl ester carboxylesterase
MPLPRAALLALTLALTPAACVPAGAGAAFIVRPIRLPLLARPPLAHEPLRVRSGDVTLAGWHFRATAPERGLVVYLHGLNDVRDHGAALAEALVPRGFSVVAYDQRGHGASGGTYCTYGVHEVDDLRAVLDAVGARGPVYLVGESMGAAVSLQAAAVEGRVAGVVAGAPFSELPTVVAENTPAFARPGDGEAAVALAEQQAGFRLADVAPVRAAPSIRVPVLLLHGTRDTFIPPSHSERILAALPGPDARRELVEGAGHWDVLTHQGVTERVTEWVEAQALARERVAAGR